MDDQVAALDADERPAADGLVYLGGGGDAALGW
jgi:hypothetical protein